MNCCTLCGGQKTTSGKSKWGRTYVRKCIRCKGTGLLNKVYEVKRLRQAQALVEAGPGMVELTQATVALSDAIRKLEAI